MSPSDFFEPAIRELDELAAQVSVLESMPIQRVLSSCRIALASVARDERAASLRDDGVVFPTLSSRGDTGSLVGEVQLTSARISSQIEDGRRSGQQPVIYFASPLQALAEQVRGVVFAYPQHDLVTELRGLDADAAELRVATATAQLVLAGESLEQTAAKSQELERRTDEVEQRAREAVEQAEQAAGITSQDELAKHFEIVRADEREDAVRLRIAAGAIGVAGPVVGVGAALVGLAHPLAVTIAIGITGLGAYLGRLAEGHMKIARWAATLEVQTKGIYGYSRLIRDRTAQDRVLETFATHAYTGHPGTADGTESPPSAAIEVERLMRLLVDMQKSQR